MQAIYEKSPFHFEAHAGVSIWTAVQSILLLSRKRDLTLTFNGLVLTVYPNSCEEEILEKYSLLCKIRNLTF